MIIQGVLQYFCFRWRLNRLFIGCSFNNNLFKPKSFADKLSLKCLWDTLYSLRKRFLEKNTALEGQYFWNTMFLLQLWLYIFFNIHRIFLNSFETKNHHKSFYLIYLLKFNKNISKKLFISAWMSLCGY